MCLQMMQPYHPMPNRRKPLLIKEWKEAHELTWAQAARLLRVNYDYLRKLGCGMARPSPRLAKQIEKHSKGEIRAVELVF